MKRGENLEKKFIILSSLIACTILYYIEQIIMADYLIKTISKVVLFTLIPYIYIKFIKKTNSKKVSFRIIKKTDRKDLKMGFIFGIVSFIIIIATYYILGSTIDMQSIAAELQNKSKITPANFIFVGLYITFGNSFLEEFFFRGFVFLNLYEKNFKKLSYIYSSVLFGIYHIAIFKTWFRIELIALALFGLITVGFVFNWLDTKSENFINSWIVHIFADTAIILIGLKMFKII